ncbi:MAG: autotransporter-associated beta strand repeat-containing protein [Luteolibacter sp.]|uniref:beta strand repeat-containing protein n=1 Tax=Luteolibacter sp. TaxID=1962973 RepID=UPI003265B719
MKAKFRSNPFLRSASQIHSRLNSATGLCLTLCIAGLAPSALADSATWNIASGTNLDWSTVANWTPNTTFPNGVGETATVTKDLTAAAGINLSQGITVGTLLLGDTASSASYTIGSTGAFTLTFDNTGSTNAVINDSPVSGTTRQDTISTNCVLNDSLDVTVGLNSLLLSGIISDGGLGKSLSKTGTGMLILSGVNTYTGTTSIESGILRMTGPSPSILGTATTPLALGTATSIGSNLSPTLQLNTDLTNPVTRDITVGASNSATTGVYTINTNNGATGVSMSGIITLNQNLTVSGNDGGGFNLSGNITTGSSDARALTVSGSSPGIFTASGVIGGGTGTIALVKAGSSLLTLSGPNTFTGGTSFGGGTVNINADAALGTAPASPATNLTFTATSTLRGDAAVSAVSLNANRNIVINTGITAAFNAGAAANVLTINGVVSNQSNTGILNLSTSANAFTTGTVVLAGSNNFAVDSVVNLGGGTNIGGGILRLANSNALGSNAIVVNATGSAGNALGEAALELAGGVTIGSNVTYNLSGHNNTVTPVGDHLRNFSGNNTFNGAIRIANTGGSYQIDSAESGSLLTFGGSFTNTLNSGRTLNFIGAGNTLVSATFAETGGTSSKTTLVKSGTGALTLSNANTFLGGVTLNAGTLNLNNATALGAAAGVFTINGGTIDNTSGTAKTITNNNPQIWNSDFAYSTSGGTNANDLSLGSGTVSLGTTAGTSRTITANGAGLLTVAGIVSNGTTANNIIKTGTGGLKLDAANTYTGGTTLQSGVLQLSNNSALGGGTLTINGGGLVPRIASRTISNPVVVGADFYLGGANVNNQMNFSGTVDLGGATRTISVVDTTVAQDSVLSGIISNGGLTKTGAGTLVLSAANTYAGPTTVNQGTLFLNNANPLASSSSITINGSGAKLIGGNAGSIPSPVTLTQGAVDISGTIPSLTVADLAENTVAAGNGAMAALTAGTLTFNGAATLNLSTTSTTVGQKLVVTNLATNPLALVTVNVTSSTGLWLDNVDYPLITFASYPSAVDASHFSLVEPAGLNFNQHAALVRTGTAIVLRITTDALVWTGNQNANWTTVPVGGSRNWTDNGNPAEYTDNSSVIFDSNSGHYLVNVAEDVYPSTVVFNAGSNDYTLSSTGGFGIQNGSLTKNGTGKLTITNNNPYYDLTTITGGTLEISGSITNSYQFSISSNAALSFDFANSPNVYGTFITGSGEVIKKGAGSLTLTGSNNFSGNLTLNAGTLNFDGASAWGSGAGTFVINGGTLDNTSGGAVAASTNKSQQWNADFPFTGSNNLDLGTGTVTLGGTGDRSVLVGGAGDILTVGEIKASSQGLTISGGGTLVATSTGAFTDASNIGGTLTVNSGTTLQINRSTGNSAGTTGDFVATGLVGSGTITNGAAVTDRSLQINNTANYSFIGTIANGGAAALALNKQGAGTLALTGTNTYTGPTVVGGGILSVRNSNALGSSAVKSVTRTGGIQLQDNISLPSAVTFTLSNDGTTGATVPYAVANVSGNNTINGVITMTSGAGSTIIQSDSGTLTLAGNITSDQARGLILQGGSSGANTVSGIISNGTSGVNSVEKRGPGFWTLTGTNTHTGTTTISEGTLQLGNGTTDGTISTTSGVTNNASLVYNWATSHTAPYVISGNGSVTKNGDGTATLTGVNTYTGTTTVNAGELAVNGTSIANTGTIVINGGKVNLTGAETVDKLYFGGVQQPAGTYSTAGDSTHFSGGGTLIVSSGPAGFGTWAAANGATGQTPGDDHDNDGVKNGIEFFVGGGTGFTVLPAVVTNAGVRTVTWPKSAGYTGAYQVQVSTDLATWTAAPGGSVVDNGSSVVFTFPAGPVIRFVRLDVTPN